jgi:trehalose-6-phosphate synthase
LVLNYFEMNQMFTEIIIKTLEEDIIWLTKN